MTMDVQTMPAGPDLDRLVAERVMAKKSRQLRDGAWCIYDTDGTTWDNEASAWRHTRFPAYSTSIAHAWEVVERMERLHFEVHITRFVDAYWDVDFSVSERPPAGEAKADTAALAICRAALVAVGA